MERCKQINHFFLYIKERHVPLYALDPTDVGTIQTANVSELFLETHLAHVAGYELLCRTEASSMCLVRHISQQRC